MGATSSTAGSSAYHIWSPNGNVEDGPCNYSQSLVANMISYWELDETSGLIAKDSIYAITGVTSSTGVTVNQTGKISKSYNFDRSIPGYIDIPNIGLDGTPFSISYWQNSTYTASSGDPGVIASANASTRNFNIINRVSGKYVAFRTLGDSGSDDTLFSAKLVENGVWHFVVCVVTGTQKLIYIDGALDNSVGWAHYLKADPNASKIAYAVNNGGFNGYLDEIGIWTRALSPTEISTLYNNGSGLQYP